MSTQAAAAPRTPAQVGNEYVILEFLPADKPNLNTAPTTGVYLPGWREYSLQTARTDQAAIRQALEGNTDGGTFVAIPVRSFKPVKVTPETKTTYKLEEAK